MYYNICTLLHAHYLVARILNWRPVYHKTSLRNEKFAAVHKAWQSSSLATRTLSNTTVALGIVTEQRDIVGAGVGQSCGCETAQGDQH